MARRNIPEKPSVMLRLNISHYYCICTVFSFKINRFYYAQYVSCQYIFPYKVFKTIAQPAHGTI